MKTNSGYMNNWKAYLVSILISFSGTAFAGNASNNNQGMPQVLTQLALVAEQLDRIQNQLEYQQAQLTELQEETIDCTPERYINGLCGDGNTPFDLVISICGNLGGEVAIGGQYALEAKIAYGGGLGWKEVGDGDFTIDGGFPIAVPAPMLGGLPIIIPNEVSVGASGSAGLGMDTCFEGIKIPIGKNVDRDRVIALLDKLQMGADQVQSKLLDAIDNTFDSQIIAEALSAKETFGSLTFKSDDPLGVFTDPAVVELASLLPAGDRMNELITGAGNMIQAIDPLNLNLCERYASSPVLGDKMGDLCAFIGTLPDHQLVTSAFQKIENIQTRVINLPGRVGDKICELISDAICDDD